MQQPVEAPRLADNPRDAAARAGGKREVERQRREQVDLEVPAYVSPRDLGGVGDQLVAFVGAGDVHGAEADDDVAEEAEVDDVLQRELDGWEGECAVGACGASTRMHTRDRQTMRDGKL